MIWTNQQQALTLVKQIRPTAVAKLAYQLRQRSLLREVCERIEHGHLICHVLCWCLCDFCCSFWFCVVGWCLFCICLKASLLLDIVLVEAVPFA